jgi:puromycin-sensitive aminopeptidase
MPKGEVEKKGKTLSFVVAFSLALLFSFVIHQLQVSSTSSTTTTTTTTTTSNMSLNSADRVLLPNDVKPRAYRLTLTPDLSAFTFAGQVEVDVDVVTTTQSITLHALDVTIDSAHLLVGADDKRIAQTGDVVYAKETESATIRFADSVAAGTARVRVVMTFRGELNDKMAGFYRSKYTVDGGREAYMATTQFEATDARRAFPCWDEPALKATFAVTLVVPKHMDALSNMPGEVVAQDAASKTYRFQPTPIMSTYLLAFCVGQFEYVEQRTANTNVLMRVYTPLGKRDQGRFALDCAAKTLDYFSDYFGVAYPLPKCDMIAIADFAAGAMENWGLITYRVTALLIDEKNSGLASKQRVAYVVAHELAHQWFGNLVTMEWWKELWLNEGFATFVGVQATAHLFPEWDMWTNFQSDYTNSALITDALASSHPIEVEVRSSAQIGEVFDVISYKKGAAIIRMINELIGEPAMRKGLNVYLKRHQYGNAVTTDLWKALGEAAGRDVAQFMARWTGVTGYPLVSVTRDAAQHSHFKVTQTRFFSNGHVDGTQSGHWHVSLRVGAAGGASAVVETSEASKLVTLDSAIAGAKWLKFNLGQACVCRIAYDDNVLVDLEAAIKSRELPTIDRLAVQSDAFALATAGRLSTATALRIATSYQHETELAVFTDLSSNLLHLLGAFGNTTSKAGIEKVIAHAFESIGAQLGWTPKPNEKPLDGLLRVVVLKTLATVGHEATVKQAKKLFAAYAAAKLSGLELGIAADLPVDLRSTVMQAAVKYGGAVEFEQVLAMFRLAESSEEQVRLLNAIGASKNAALHLRALEFALAENGEVRNQDVYVVIGSAAGANPDATWSFVKQRWAEFDKRFGGGSFLLARMVSYATSGFASEEKAQEIAAFFKANPCPSADRTIEQSLETVRAKAAWVARDHASLHQFLTELKLH